LKIDLKNITLLAIDCISPEKSIKALQYSSRYINFGEILLISHYKPEQLPNHIRYENTIKHTHATINRFAMEELPDLIHTEYVLSIQEDGFIINPFLWNNEFFNYDYIGAPWPSNLDWCKKNKVGNGGFVLKSKKFLNLEKQNPYIEGMHNDVLVTNYYYDLFTSKGIKYAPIEVACRFSLEHQIPDYEYDLDKTFGFHGKLTQQAIDKISILENYKI
jgi:hypothetical protein